MKVERIDLERVRTNSANPRNITDGNFGKLIDSVLALPKMLELRPIVVDETLTALGGNMRLRALVAISQMEEEELRERILSIRDVKKKRREEKEGLVSYWMAWKDKPTAQIVRAEELTDAEKQEFIIKDNASFGEWDVEALLAGWDEEDLTNWSIDIDEALRKATEGLDSPVIKEAEEDNFDEEKEQIPEVCKVGDLWQLGEHRLLCGDATKREDVERLMDGERADLLLTDPPYNVDYSSKNEYLSKIDKANCIQSDIENDTMVDAEFLQFLTKAFTNANEVLKEGGAFYVWYSSNEHINFETGLNKASLNVSQQLIWNKSHFVLGRKDYQQKHEPCFYGWKEGAKHYFINSKNQTTVIPDVEEIDLDRMKKDEMRELLEELLYSDIPTSVIDCPKPLKNDLHPTMKPIRLMGYLMGNSSREGEKVLDMFGGSGTTLIACEQLGRKCRMMEITPHYCDVIIQRWEKFTGKKAVLIRN